MSKGQAITINIDGTTTTTELDSPTGNLPFLQKQVGGYIEIVPYFREYGGKPCVAFCNEEGKLMGLDLNLVATAAWIEAMNKTIGLYPGDVLCGPVVIVSGDKEFMSNL